MTKQAHRFYVCKAGKGAGSLSLQEPPHMTVEQAREHRNMFDVPTAIYQISLGMIPKFIEGDALHGRQE